jgi:diguanylate cyclase (GGDEF)-like protein
MLAEPLLDFLLASPDATLLTALEPVLRAVGSIVEIALTSEAALCALTRHDPPALALLDARLTDVRLTDALLADPHPPSGICASDIPISDICDLLVAVRTQVGPQRLSIVLISEEASDREVGFLDSGLVEDIVPLTMDAAWWRLRIERVLQARRQSHELEALREASRRNLQMDHLTGIFNRETLMAVLFRETDRVQRMKSSLAMILFDIDDFGHWNSQLGAEVCDDLLRQVVTRTSRMLRSYDVLGRPGKDEFLAALPGCTQAQAAGMAERLRGIFGTPFEVGGKAIRLSACFGIALSLGRSPVVVLREAEQALAYARAAGPEAIHWFDDAQPTPFDLIPARLLAAGDDEAGLMGE